MKFKHFIDSRLTIRSIIVMSVILTTIMVSAIFMVSIFYKTYESKSSDTWAMMFLDLEKRASIFSRKIGTSALVSKKDYDLGGVGFYRIDTAPNTGEKSLTYQSGLNISLSKIDKFGLSIESLEQDKTEGRISIGSSKGKSYVFATTTPNTVEVKDIKIADVIDLPESKLKNINAFVLNRNGTLIFSNDYESGDYVSKEIVQRYIKSALWQGQFEYAEPLKDGANYRGFFQEVVGTNLVMFVEVPISYVIAKTSDAIYDLLYVFLILILILPALAHVAIHMFRKKIYNIAQNKVGFKENEV
jgi:uncharacterized membrane protein